MLFITANPLETVYASVNDLSVGSEASQYSYTMKTDPDGFIVDFGSSYPYYYFKIDGVNTKTYHQATYTYKFSDKADKKVTMYVNDALYGCFSSSGGFELVYETGGWSISTSDEVYDHNMSVLGKWTTDMMTEEPDSIVALSDQICKGLTSDYDKAKAIHDWICENIYYNKDSSGDVIASLDATKYIESKLCVCGGYAEVFTSLCHAQGIPSVNVYGISGTTSTLNTALSNQAISVAAKYWNHAWNECYVDGRWILVDCTMDTGREYSAGTYYDKEAKDLYFDMDPAYFSITHLACSRSGKTVNGPSAWSMNDVATAMGEGIVPYGWSNYADAITRSDFCDLAVKALENHFNESISTIVSKYGTGDAISFTDTNSSNVKYLTQLGIVSGYGNGLFGATNSIKRQEAAAILTHMAKIMGVTSSKTQNTFADAASAGDWANSSIAFISGIGVMSGIGNNNFSPLTSYTKEQSIVTMVRLLSVV
jgi:transglutaminase-like putative cysteine protease